MIFSIQDWRNTYDMVHKLGKILMDSRPTCDNDKKPIPALSYLPSSEQEDLEIRIKSMTQRTSKYMDQCGMRMPRPLWYYNRKDKQTHVSDPAFAYQHLLEDK